MATYKSEDQRNVFVRIMELKTVRDSLLTTGFLAISGVLLFGAHKFGKIHSQQIPTHKAREYTPTESGVEIDELKTVPIFSKPDTARSGLGFDKSNG